ncbi:folate-binding protein [Acetobacter sp. AN02]|uniref:CAF17-like 4Fe-4S cluster assembly/insertion protein YgfZ n=1 Tax=Acetobacter sp. AN02 TaxID=2894186 RepID=UPI0024341650|nr:folate-binding protein [Acetobacter sp. AN02]MDG6094617.1 folate-binding protein [Acetobacter sp. AN02]
MDFLTALPGRGVIAISGADRVRFLQGLVSSDVTLATPDTAIWAGYLTPQGRWLADFFIFSDEENDRLLLDCEQDMIPDLITRLSRFRLRADVRLEAAGYAVCARWGDLPEGKPGDGIIQAADPRHALAGLRLLVPGPAPAGTCQSEEYDRHRLTLGLPDGSRDCVREKTLLLEANFDVLNGVSWTKGCYMGQELTARTHYRTLLRKRLVPVTSDHPLPPPGTPVLGPDGEDAGEMRSSCDHQGLALLRIAHMDKRLTCGEGVLTPHVPNWLAPALKEDREDIAR